MKTFTKPLFLIIFFTLSVSSCVGKTSISDNRLVITEVKFTVVPYPIQTLGIIEIDPQTSTPYPEPIPTNPLLVEPSRKPTAAPLCPTDDIERKIMNPEARESYIGKRFSSLAYPDGLTLKYAGPVPDAEGYVLTEVTWNNVLNILWLEKLICLDANNMPYHEIKDVVFLPQIAEDSELALWSCRTRTTDEIILRSVAFGIAENNEEYLAKIYAAWTLNIEEEKFESISTENLICKRSWLPHTER